MTGNGHTGNPAPKRGIALFAITAALFYLIACGGPAPTPNIPIAPPATPAPTQPPTATPPPAPTEPSATPTTPPATRAANPGPPATARPTPSPTATATPAPPTPDEDTAANDVADIRRIVYDYWVALNDYDVDLALTMLEDGYRAQEEESIRSEIGQLKLFRAKLEVSEETQPALNANGDYETYLTIGTPVDTRRVMMVFRRIDGQWWIVFSEEVE